MGEAGLPHPPQDDRGPLAQVGDLLGVDHHALRGALALDVVILDVALPRLDGLILTGSRSNVCPDFYEGPPHADAGGARRRRRGAGDACAPLTRRAFRILNALFAPS